MADRYSNFIENQQDPLDDENEEVESEEDDSEEEDAEEFEEEEDSEEEDVEDYEEEEDSEEEDAEEFEEEEDSEEEDAEDYEEEEDSEEEDAEDYEEEEDSEEEDAEEFEEEEDSEEEDAEEFEEEEAEETEKDSEEIYEIANDKKPASAAAASPVLPESKPEPQIEQQPRSVNAQPIQTPSQQQAPNRPPQRSWNVDQLTFGPPSGFRPNRPTAPAAAQATAQTVSPVETAPKPPVGANSDLSETVSEWFDDEMPSTWQVYFEKIGRWTPIAKLTDFGKKGMEKIRAFRKKRHDDAIASDTTDYDAEMLKRDWHFIAKRSVTIAIGLSVLLGGIYGIGFFLSPEKRAELTEQVQSEIQKTMPTLDEAEKKTESLPSVLESTKEAITEKAQDNAQQIKNAAEKVPTADEMINDLFGSAARPTKKTDPEPASETPNEETAVADPSHTATNSAADSTTDTATNSSDSPFPSFTFDSLPAVEPAQTSAATDSAVNKEISSSIPEQTTENSAIDKPLPNLELSAPTAASNDSFDAPTLEQPSSIAAPSVTVTPVPAAPLSVPAAPLSVPTANAPAVPAANAIRSESLSVDLGGARSTPNLADELKNTVSQIDTQISSVGSSFGQSIKAAENSVQQWADNAQTSIQGQLQQAQNSLQSGAEQVQTSIQNGLDQTQSAAQNARAATLTLSPLGNYSVPGQTVDLTLPNTTPSGSLSPANGAVSSPSAALSAGSADSPLTVPPTAAASQSSFSSVAIPRSAVAGTASVGSAASGTRTYRAKANDNLLVIAENELGDSTRWSEIRRLNPDKDLSGSIAEGTVITLPKITD